jgi:hypothetical protein
MPRYEFRILESREHYVEYTVEAADEAEAREKAEKGETEKERDIDFNGVTDRVIVAGPHLMDEPPKKPIVVCLCGSTRFAATFREQNLKETLAGRIVLSIGCDFKSDQALCLDSEDKKRLDQLHLHKIDLCDEVFILNVGGYMGESTKRELAYAQIQNKKIRFLEESGP